MHGVARQQRRLRVHDHAGGVGGLWVGVVAVRGVVGVVGGEAGGGGVGVVAARRPEAGVVCR